MTRGEWLCLLSKLSCACRDYGFADARKVLQPGPIPIQDAETAAAIMAEAWNTLMAEVERVAE